MKKILMIAAIALGFAAAASAQEWKVGDTTLDFNKKTWRVGARLGSGFQAVGEWEYNSKNYIEARFGMAWYHGGLLTADFTFLHNWNVCKMDWTPGAGQWFFDAGVGLTVGGRANFVNLGVAGSAKLGIEFNSAPIRLSLDFSPAIGPWIVYIPGGGAGAGFNAHGFANLGLSAVYCF